METATLNLRPFPGFLQVFFRYVLQDQLTAEEKAAVENWAAENAEHQAMLDFFSDTSNLSAFFRAAIHYKFGPGSKRLPPNELVDLFNEKNKEELPPFFFG